jgi:hypothetical protein
MKCFVIPVIIGATVIVSKSLKNISGNNTRTTLNIFSTKTANVTNVTNVIAIILNFTS